MAKTSVLFILLLSMIFAQMIPAYSSDSEASDIEDVDENESEEEIESESPALTCLLFENLGCNTECSTIASAFSIKSSGKCTDDYICQCSLEQDSSLEGLFRAKFNAENALKEIKKDEDLVEKVLEVLQVPFQTSTQTKTQLKEVLPATIHAKLTIKDTTPAASLVSNTGDLNRDKIENYVSEKLKPVLKSSNKQLISTDYKSNMKKSLQHKTDEDLQSIIDEVRRTKNNSLARIVDDYLKSNKIKEKKNTDEDDLADVMGYLIIDQFVNYIEQNKKKPTSKKSTGKPSRRNNSKKSKNEDKKSSTNQVKGKETKKSSPKEDTNKKTPKSSSDRFELPGFDKDFQSNYGGNINETFKTKDYTVYYQRSSGGATQFTWKKGNDQVVMSISAGDVVNQDWSLGDVKIHLDQTAGGVQTQVWDFGKTKYTYSKSSSTNFAKRWANGQKDEDKLKEYQDLIADWCDKNSFLIRNPGKNCIIY